MSGGHFNYEDSQLKNTIFDWEDKVSNQFQDPEISELVFDVLTLIHDYDWYISGDTSLETWLEAKLDFKKKWLRKNNVATLEKIIEDRIVATSLELKEMLGDLKNDEQN